MKQTPKDAHLNMVLRSSALVAGGFLGDDRRSVTEVVDADAGDLSRLDVTTSQLAQRMKEITERAARGLGTWVEIDEQYEAMVDEARGLLPCPWPHGGYYPKRVTTLKVVASGRTFRWSDLNIHMIEAHGFFEGKGSAFRIEPAEIVGVLF